MSSDPMGRLSILVVDDEPMLLRVVAITLRNDGFEVIEAADGAAALEVLESGEKVDVLLTDVKMPGLNGYQLAEASLALRPAVPVVLMTGYADEVIPESIRNASIPVIRKPFNFATLGSSVRAVASR